MDEEELEELGLFVSGDGIRTSAPWRLQSCGPDGALSQKLISALAERFGLAEDEMGKLSRSLGWCLDPRDLPLFVSVRRSTAKERASRRVKKALAAITTARKRAAAANSELAELYPDFNRDPDGAQAFVETRNEVQRLTAELSRQEAALSTFATASSSLLVLEPTDKRQAVDQRRQLVLRRTFQFWYDAGRKLTYTTDTQTSERRGALIEFVNAVVACVTEPSSTLSGHTIVRELASFNPIPRDVFEAVRAELRRSSAPREP